MTPKPKPDDEPDAIDLEQDRGLARRSPSKRTRMTIRRLTPMATSTTNATTRTRPCQTLPRRLESGNATNTSLRNLL